MTLTSALPALAAKIVDVRVGRHAGFTRIVFELDHAAGYKIERHAPVPGIAELVVSLEASSSSHKLQPPKQSLIESVAVESDGQRSVAHITLARDGLRLKEMILAKPPRIVLDVLNDAPVVKSKSKPAPKPVAKAPPPPAPKPALVPTPRPAPVSESVVAATRHAIEPEKAPAEVERASADPVAAAPPAPRARERVARSPVPSVRPTPPAAKPATPRVPEVRSVSTTSREPEGSLFSARNAAFAAVGIVLLVAGGWLVARRRGGALGDEKFDDAYDDDNPFAGLGEGLGSEQSAADAQVFTPAPEPAGVDVSQAASAQSELFAAPAMPDDDDKPESAESAGGPMDTLSSDVTPMIDSNPPPAMGDMPDIARMLRELESRISQLESRLEEAVDARERLERQVVAQTEELRVQRAAIARTQRAVRNMNQPTDDLATEPAIREPRPEGE